MTQEEKKQKQYEKALAYQKKSREKQIENQKNKVQKKYKFKKSKINPVSEERKKLFILDKEFYKEIWNERPHYCAECGVFLGDAFEDMDGKILNITRYAHIIPKGRYPYLRHYKNNINLLCNQHHFQFDHTSQQSVESMKIYNKEQLDKLIKLHNDLKASGDESFK